MDYELIKTSVLAGNSLALIVIAAYQWLERKTGAPFKSIKELEERINKKCERITKIEMDLQGFPHKDEVVRLHERIDGLNQTVNNKVDQLKDAFSKESKELSLLLGRIIGQIDQLNIPRRDR